MNDSVVRIFVTGVPPDVFQCAEYPLYNPTPECPFPGFLMEITGTIARYINSTIVSILNDGSENYGTLQPDGRFSGFLGEVENGTVDVIATLFQYTADRARHFDFSYPVFNMRITFYTITKPRSLSGNIWDVFKPFTLALWMVILGSLIINAAYGTFIDKVEHTFGLTKYFHLLDRSWHYVKLQVFQQDEEMEYDSHAGRFALTSFVLFQVAIFGYLYQNFILAGFLVGQTSVPFSTVDEMIVLLSSHSYSMVSYASQYQNHWFWNSINTSSSAQFAQLRDALKNNPVVVLPTLDAAVAHLSEGGHIFMAQDDDPVALAVNQLCDIYSVVDESYEAPGYFFFQQNSSRTRQWNHGIIMNQDFIRRTYEKYFSDNYVFSDVNFCVESYKTETAKTRSLDLIDFFSSFLIYFIVLGAGFVILAVEIVLYIFLKAIRKFLSERSNYEPRHMIFAFPRF